MRSRWPRWDGPGPALALVDGLVDELVDGLAERAGRADRAALDGYHVFHAIRADLLRRLHRNVDAVLAYEAAIASTENAAERDFLRRRRESLGV